MSDKLKDIIIYGIAFIVTMAAIVFSTLFFVGCKTFEPIWIEKLPSECNMTLNTYRLYYNSGDKSATMPSSSYCYKKLHRIYCKVEAYGEKNILDYDNAEKYRNYSQCLSELK